MHNNVDYSGVNKRNFGLLVKAGRKAKGYSQEKLGELIGVSDRSISCIERGKTFPSQENIFKLVKILNISVEDFVLNSADAEELLGEIESIDKLSTLTDDQRLVIRAFIESLELLLVKPVIETVVDDVIQKIKNYDMTPNNSKEHMKS